MTAQIGDTCRIKRKEYQILDCEKDLFDPRSVGISTTSCSTACWRGFKCEYVIKQNELLLSNLIVCCNECVEFNGIKPQELLERNPVGNYLYEDLNYKINYTGKLLLGDKFIQKYYIHMGFQNFWAFKDVKEYIFEEGNCIKYQDCSDIAKFARNIIDNPIIVPLTDKDKEYANKTHMSKEDINRFKLENFILQSFSRSHKERTKLFKLLKQGIILDE